MIPIYEDKKENLRITYKDSKHFPPHLHDALELIYVTNGSLELGVGQEFYHMEKGDFAIVFPNMIHHYQVFSSDVSRAFYLMPLVSLSGQFRDELQKLCPEDPVIKEANVHPDIPDAIMHLYKDSSRNPIVEQAYIQIILARSMPCFRLVEKSNFGSDDIIYKTVSYIAGHFKDEVTLDMMAKDLGVSKYIISRVFSSVFHKNFNQYVNEQRLNYVCSLLECTDRSITDIGLDAGFQSQRTFNRAFQETYKMTPREYRNIYKEKYVVQQNKDNNEI